MKQILMSLALIALTTACNSQKNTTVDSPNQAERPAQRTQQGPPSMDKIFEMDANKDGKLSKTEVKGPLSRDFAKIDTNQDGFISREELKKAPKPSKGQRPPRNN